MKNFVIKIISFIRRKKWLVGAGVVILVVVVLLLGGNGKELKTATVERGTIVAEVSVTGKVKPAQNIELAFEKGGRILAVYANVGDKVISGQRLVELENGDLKAAVLQAQAALQVQGAKLAEIKKETRPEEIQIKETELAKAKEDLTGHYNSSVNVSNDSFSKANDAVVKQTDDLFTEDNSSSPRLSFEPSDGQLKNDSQSQRALSGGELIAWANELNQMKSGGSSGSALDFLKKAQTHTDIIRKFLNTLAETLNKTTTLPSATLTAYRTSINTALTNINTAASAISTQIQTITAQQLTVQKVEQELALKLAGSTSEQIQAQEALVKEAEAQLAAALAQLEKTIIRSPFNGMVTKRDAEKGEIISVNSVVMAVIGSGVFEIETSITESDIAKISAGDIAKVTLDAYGPGTVFEAKVIHRDISETMIEGIPTYKTILQFVAEDERILPGLTADADILTDKKENVLFIPTRNITTRDGEKYVKLLIDEKNQETKEVKIETGLRGSDGRTEVVLGLKEGDKIVIE